MIKACIFEMDESKIYGLMKEKKVHNSYVGFEGDMMEDKSMPHFDLQYSKLAV